MFSTKPMALRIFLLMMFVFSSAISAGRPKRSDDPAPLQTMVENLAQQVNTLNSAVEALKNKQDSLSTVVAFFAKATTNTTVAPHGVMILPQVLANAGNGYNAHTGVFTAPVSGLYQFQATVMGDNSRDFLYGGIYVGSSVLVWGISDMRHGYWDTPSMNVIKHVNAGQTVELRSGNSDVATFHPYTSFSGFLLQAD